MALILTGLIWVTYAVAIAILVSIASIFVYVYQKPRDRAASVTTVCIFTVSALLATVLLLPVDVALVSATVRSTDGIRKDWATQDEVDKIVYTLQVVYYTLYSLDAALCLIVVPFTYFFYEEYDEQENEVGSQTIGDRIWGAFKYTIIFIVLVVVLFLVGFFIPAAKYDQHKHKGLEYFKDLLSANNGERALSFALGLLITIGSLLYALYTAAGLAILPIRFIKSAPSVSSADLLANTSEDLTQNRERQRFLEQRNEGREGGLDTRDRRELEQLVRDERTLIRRERLAAENSGEGQHGVMRVWTKTRAVFRPVKLIGGLFLMVVSIGVWVSMLITGIDKVKNSVCGRHCGYLLGHVNIFQPANSILVHTAKVFPIDYIVFALLVFFLFSSSVLGIATIGIRFLWLTIFKIRKGHTSPQAMLMATVLLTLIVLAIDYSVMMIIAPQYATFGPQTYCDRPVKNPTEQPDCSKHRDLIRSCTETAENPVARDICTPSVASTFINRSTINFPFLGAVDFWAQFAFLGVYFVVAILAIFRTPKLDIDALDEDLEEEEEEGLLQTTGRRFTSAWNDIVGRARKNNPVNYGTNE